MNEEIIKAMEECKNLIHEMRSLRLNNHPEEAKKLGEEIEERIVEITNHSAFFDDIEKKPDLYQAFLMDKYFSLITYFDLCKEL